MCNSARKKFTVGTKNDFAAIKDKLCKLFLMFFLYKHIIPALFRYKPNFKNFYFRIFRHLISSLNFNWVCVKIHIASLAWSGAKN